LVGFNLDFGFKQTGVPYFGRGTYRDLNIWTKSKGASQERLHVFLESGWGCGWRCGLRGCER
jgi:hypothetical protein